MMESFNHFNPPKNTSVHSIAYNKVNLNVLKQTSIKVHTITGSLPTVIDRLNECIFNIQSTDKILYIDIIETLFLYS